MFASPASLRAFGRAEDLELDFADADRPALVSALLAACDDGLGDAEFWWRQPVGARTAALLQLLAASDAGGRFELHARCHRGECGTAFEFALPFAALQTAQPQAGPVRIVLDGERSVALRLPTGCDLRRWRAAPPSTRGALLADLRVDGELRPADEAPLSEAMARHDPLVAFTVACRCPACDAAQQVEVDLEGLALARLGAQQRALLHEVHRLASRYGWTEAQVLAVAPPRRARSLALIDAEEP